MSRLAVSGGDGRWLEGELGEIRKRQTCHDVRMSPWLVDSYDYAKGEGLCEANSAAHCKMRIVAQTRRFGFSHRQQTGVPQGPLTR